MFNELKKSDVEDNKVLLVTGMAGAYDGEKIKAALVELEFDGATGPLAFNELGDRTAGAFEIWEVVKDATTPTDYKNVKVEK